MYQYIWYNEQVKQSLHSVKQIKELEIINRLLGTYEHIWL